jgi:hypothetical protein
MVTVINFDSYQIKASAPISSPTFFDDSTKRVSIPNQGAHQNASQGVQQEDIELALPPVGH